LGQYLGISLKAFTVQNLDTMTRVIDGTEVTKHSTAESCWVVIHGKVWDVTGKSQLTGAIGIDFELKCSIDFLSEHPGGDGIILKCAGQDATEPYDSVHNPELVDEMLPTKSCLGAIKPDSLPTLSPESQGSGQAQERPPPEFPPLVSIVNVNDFEKVAEKYLSAPGWAYYSSGAEDEICLDDTRRLFSRITLRPRILRNVQTVSTDTKILGHNSALPFYISPTGLGRYAHKEAEKIITLVAGQEGIIYMTPTVSSASHEVIYGARVDAQQPIFQQLYFHRDRAKAEALIRKVEALGACAYFVTVDSPVIGRRERDERINLSSPTPSSSSAGVAKTASSDILNPRLVWDDIKWMRSVTRRPIVLKGVQSVEDAVLAHAHGVDGIVVSNHGGRSLDTAQAPILTLLEIQRHAPHLLSPLVRESFEIFIDGGVRRGTDAIKALALGATAVGIGRPFLYSMTADYGEEGVKHLVRMLRGEIETGMTMLGATNIGELVPEMVNSERAECEVSRRIKL
jgi:L-lactate dehydrogenase (cytochrome)